MVVNERVRMLYKIKFMLVRNCSPQGWFEQLIYVLKCDVVRFVAELYDLLFTTVNLHEKGRKEQLDLGCSSDC